MSEGQTPEQQPKRFGKIKDIFRRKEKAAPPEQKQSQEIKLEDALAKLSPTDAQALTEIGSQFTDILKTDHMSGGIALDASSPSTNGQQEISLGVFINPTHQISEFLPERKQAEWGMVPLRSVAEDLRDRLGYEIQEETLPALDTNDPRQKLLAQNGSIKIGRENETPILLRNEYKGDMIGALKDSQKPFAILVDQPNQTQ